MSWHPPKPRRVAMIGVRVTPDMAERLYSLARKQRTDISKITSRFFERLIERDGKQPLNESPKHPTTPEH